MQPPMVIDLATVRTSTWARRFGSLNERGTLFCAAENDRECLLSRVRCGVHQQHKASILVAPICAGLGDPGSNPGVVH